MATFKRYLFTISFSLSLLSVLGCYQPSMPALEIPTALSHDEAAEQSQALATEMMRNDPTFAFDGIANSLRLTDTIEEECPFCWTFTFEFESQHPGYGYRTGQMLAELITHHQAVVAVEQGIVESAIMDGEWNMLSQMSMTSREESQRVAEEFIRSSPTFIFDGVRDTLRLVDVSEGECLSCWTFTFEFDSQHPGYGYRTGETLPEEFTLHSARVVVQKGSVISAMMDDQWDMVAAMESAVYKDLYSIAEEVVTTSPTFLFDGIDDSLKQTGNVDALCPYCSGYVFEFESKHAGYGDRNGQMLAEVITSHTVVVILGQGQVKFAVMDGVWDILNQQMITSILPKDTGT